jgi:hypothetical protein
MHKNVHTRVYYCERIESRDGCMGNEGHVSVLLPVCTMQDAPTCCRSCSRGWWPSTRARAQTRCRRACASSPSHCIPSRTTCARRRGRIGSKTCGCECENEGGGGGGGAWLRKGQVPVAGRVESTANNTLPSAEWPSSLALVPGRSLSEPLRAGCGCETAGEGRCLPGEGRCLAGGKGRGHWVAKGGAAVGGA